MRLDMFNEREALQLFQTLLVAKFDSGKAELICGSDLVHKILVSIAEHPFVDEAVGQIVRGFFDAGASAQIFEICKISIADYLEVNDGTSNLAVTDYAKKCAYPYRLSGEQLDMLATMNS